MAEGYVKYKCKLVLSEPPTFDLMDGINKLRTKLHSLGFIGCYPDGIGYGNISFRIAATNEFIISGTQTGGSSILQPEQYSHVTDFDIDGNELHCKGQIAASSEALTHAAVYLSNPEINVVVHIHSLELWQNLLNKAVTTPEEAQYGTPELANEIIKILQKNNYPSTKLIALGGHEEGLLFFGKDVEETESLFSEFI